MPLRRKKKSSVREAFEDKANVAAAHAEDLGHTISEKAPVVRDQLVTSFNAAAEEILKRLPDLVDRLPDQVSEKLPESVQKPKKKRRVRKVLVLGTVVAAGGVAFSKLKGGPTPQPTYTPPPPAETPA